ncbi:MAG: ribonuclease HII [Dehalococcoidales bacterium]|nr:ribonuclease HII [Dehalococcoidales bacterium]
MRCREQGYRLVAGIDEVGRGCLAGPVVASAVIFPSEIDADWSRYVRDSKLLSPAQREYLSPYIHEAAVSIGTGMVEPYLIDALGMTRAVGLAVHRAVESLLPRPDYLLIDYFSLPDLNIPQKGVKNGDTLCFSIACASIVAKVFRDRLMVKLAAKYPGYALERHKGYGTEEHLACLRKLGPSTIHRRLFHPVRNIAQLSFNTLLEKAE